MFYECNAKYSTLELVFLVEGDTTKSNLVAQFLGENNYSFEQENLQIIFQGFLTNVKEDKINAKASKLTLTLEGYKTTELKTSTTFSSSTTLTVDGNLPTDYVIVEIEPEANIPELTLTIGKTEFTLENLIAGIAYTVDGAKGKVYYTADDAEVSKFADFTGEFPQLQCGSNNITVSASSGSANMKIKYKGRWI